MLIHTHFRDPTFSGDVTQELRNRCDIFGSASRANTGNQGLVIIHQPGDHCWKSMSVFSQGFQHQLSQGLPEIHSCVFCVLKKFSKMEFSFGVLLNPLLRQLQ